MKNLVDDTTKEVADTRPNIFVSTLSKYFYQNTPFKEHEIISPEDRKYRSLIQHLSINIPLDLEFIIDEIEYLMGKLPSKYFESYIDIERVGRGNKPRVDKTLRRKILDEIVYPTFRT